jgi:quinol monooxygenase YgiN
MAPNVWWVLELSVQTGREEACETLLGEMVSSAEANEPGTLSYECSRSADGSSWHIFERYIDSPAALVHLATFGEKFAGRFLSTFQPVRFVVYGRPSPEVKEALAGFSPTYMQPVSGLTR